ncbi:hypothetical protein [Streptomyces enissocaesilis]|uniref:hypothetical protein n=1 Tax=Streptomyces enissocaesilis TaxID=332589 RepID=UPI003CD07CDC
MPLIEEAHATSGGTYGARPITRALRRKGHEVRKGAGHRPVPFAALAGGVVPAVQRMLNAPRPWRYLTPVLKHRRTLLVGTADPE